MMGSECGTGGLYSCSSLQILLNFGGVLVIESSGFFVEAHVAVIDVVHISFFIECSSPTILGALLNPIQKRINQNFKPLHFAHCTVNSHNQPPILAPQRVL